MKIACWSGPRNISTALMRSWSSRSDTAVIDEPFYAYYLKEKQLKHPMYKEILNTYSTKYENIVKYLITDIPKNKKIWYQKHMAHHLINLDNIDWIKKFENCFLIRHPKEVINSYIAKNQLYNVKELGYPQQYEIVKFLRKSGKSFIIIDSKDILTNPENALSKWCEKININFEKSMLNWEKGNHSTDGIWWKHWYENVIQSTSFQDFKKKDISIENKYDSIYNESMNYYNYLREIK